MICPTYEWKSTSLRCTVSVVIVGGASGITLAWNARKYLITPLGSMRYPASEVPPPQRSLLRTDCTDYSDPVDQPRGQLKILLRTDCTDYSDPVDQPRGRLYRSMKMICVICAVTWSVQRVKRALRSENSEAHEQRLYNIIAIWC